MGCGLSKYLCSWHGEPQHPTDNCPLVALGTSTIRAVDHHSASPAASPSGQVAGMTADNNPPPQSPTVSCTRTERSPNDAPSVRSLTGSSLPSVGTDGERQWGWARDNSEHNSEGGDCGEGSDEATCGTNSGFDTDEGNVKHDDNHGYARSGTEESGSSDISDKLGVQDQLDDGDEKRDADFFTLREKCGRFRVLVIGKANAGKTTILQKMCNTTEVPVIHNQYGKKIDQSIIQPTDGRGIHDINNELTFSSNKAFVFHDSPGFEAGSVRELEDVQAFISKRAASGELKDQLHAIWYCLPTDNDRPLSSAEISFFEQGTGRTPVIAIFTKYDGMILKEYNSLRFEGGCPRAQAWELAPRIAEVWFLESEHYLKRVCSAAFPPKRWLTLQDMHRPENTCAELSRQTLEALDSKILQQLFVSVQQTNIGLSTEWAIKNPVSQALRQTMHQDNVVGIFENMINSILGCYRHLVGLSPGK